MWKIEKLVSKGDYNYAVVPKHPNSGKHGYVLEHRIIMENHLGRLLNSNEVVHHKDENKKNNDISNLEVLSDIEHVRLHSSIGRTYVRLCCPECKRIFVIEKRKSFLSKRHKYTCCSMTCRGKFSRRIQLHGETIETKKAVSGNLLEVFHSKTIPRKLN